MSPWSVIELLPLHAMGALGEDEAAAVERAMGTCSVLRDELAGWREVLAAMTVGSATPDEAVRARLLATLGSVARFAAEVAELFDVSEGEARAVLGRVDDAIWKPFLPGIERLPISPGPRFAGTQCNLIRIAGGTRFPYHRHLGQEVSMVLQGGAHMSDGRDLLPGDIAIADTSHEHDFVIEGDEACIVAVRMVGIVPA